MEFQAIWNSKLNDASLENGLSVSAPAFLEVRPATTVVYTFMTEGQPGDQLTATVDLKEADGTTLLILTNLCVSKEARDAMVNSGAAAGAKMAWDRLAELLAEAGA